MKRTIIMLLIAVLFAGGLFANDLKTGNNNSDRPKVALVLSGGGAKGIAHIPVIEALEKYGIPIDKVYGTSMGALIGGIYCAGYSPKDILDVVTKRDLTSMFETLESTGYRPLANVFDYSRSNIVSFTLDNGIIGSSALIDDYAIMNFFYSVIGNVPENIDFNTDLDTPFSCNATNMKDGSKYRWDKGNLVMALRSSMSLPLAFKPVVLEDGTVLMDGGLESNYTVDEAIKDGYDIVICVTLPKNSTEDIREKYQSMSGVVSGTLDVIMKNVSRGQKEQTKFNIFCDVTGYSVLGFADVKGILDRGYQAVEKYKDVFEDIASHFTEEQKVYKDPNRRGVYFSKYPQRVHKEIESSISTKVEPALSRTRLSIGFFGSIGLQFVKDGKSTTDGDDNGKVRKSDLPTISMNYYKPKVFGNPNFGLDMTFKFDIPDTLTFIPNLYYLLTKNTTQKLYAYLGIRGDYGVLTVNTNKRYASLTQNGIPEALLDGHGGFLLTNRKNYNLRLEGTAQNLWVSSGYLDNMYEGYKSNDKDYTNLDYYFYPKISLGYTRYNPTSLDFFALDRKRMDIILRGGMYDTAEKGLVYTYAMGFEGYKSFKLSTKDAVWIDIKAVTSREPRMLSGSYFPYGGFYGMPGYLESDMYRDYMYLGTGYERILKKGISNKVLQVKLGAGIRSSLRYDWSVAYNDSLVVDYPFSECIDNISNWDIGAAIGFGIASFIGGDFLIGYGINLHDEKVTHAVYFEIH